MTTPDPVPLPPWMTHVARIVPTLVIIGAVAVAAIIGVAVIVAVTADHPPASPAMAMLDVAPGGIIHAADLPDHTAVHYRMAEDHPELFAAVPCFCGCDTMLAHRHLLDCFIRSDGSGWEAHAAGCGVCLGEAQQIADLLSAGETDYEAIRTAVIAQWGDPYAPTELENT